MNEFTTNVYTLSHNTHTYSLIKEFKTKFIEKKKKIMENTNLLQYSQFSGMI